MDRRADRLRKRLAKKGRRGFRGYPIATIACYGPDDRRASKLVAAIIEHEGAEASAMEKWYAERDDVRDTLEIMEAVAIFFERHGALSVTMPEGIIGCPHEEGIDYDGTVCPDCPYWANRDRWSGIAVH